MHTHRTAFKLSYSTTNTTRTSLRPRPSSQAILMPQVSQARAHVQSCTQNRYLYGMHETSHEPPQPLAKRLSHPAASDQPYTSNECQPECTECLHSYCTSHISHFVRAIGLPHSVHFTGCAVDTLMNPCSHKLCILCCCCMHTQDPGARVTSWPGNAPVGGVNLTAQQAAAAQPVAAQGSEGRCCR